MKLFDLFKKDLPSISDEHIVAVCDGEMIEPSKIEDKMFAQEMMGKTIGFIPSSNDIVSPCNGTLEVLFPTGHAFAIRRNDGTGVLVHIGIDTVNLNGEGFKVFAKKGDIVKAGQKIVKIDRDFIKEKGLSTTTMLVITEPVEGIEYNFCDYGSKNKGEIIL